MATAGCFGKARAAEMKKEVLNTGLGGVKLHAKRWLLACWLLPPKPVNIGFCPFAVALFNLSTHIQWLVTTALLDAIVRS